MPTRVFALDEESRKHLHAILMNIFLDGECYAFATALHEGLGWPLVGIIEENGVVRHAGVRSPDGRIFDARGYVTEEKFPESFHLPSTIIIRPVTLAELTREGEPTLTREHSIRTARKLAECLWPELPWKDSLAARARAFCDELETLSRKHGLWIRASYPGARPVFARGEGDEAGYTLWPTHDGGSFTLDRELAS